MSYKNFNVDSLLDQIWDHIYDEVKNSENIPSESEVKAEMELILFVLSFFPSKTINVDYFPFNSKVRTTIWKDDWVVAKNRLTQTRSTINKNQNNKVNKIFGLINMRALVPKHISKLYDSFTVDAFETSFNTETIKVSDVIKNDSLMREIFEIIYEQYINDFNINIETFDLDKIEKLPLLNIWSI